MPLYWPCALAVVAGPAALRSADLVAEVSPGLVRYAEWTIAGPLLSLTLADGRTVSLAEADQRAEPAADRVVVQANWPAVGLEAEWTVAFAADGRTLRLAPRLRATGAPVHLARAALLEARVAGQALERVGPAHVSCPVIGDGLFVGVEHPSAMTVVDGETVRISQPIDLEIGREWVALPPAVVGSSHARGDRAALKRAFLRYLETVRIHPRDIHVHYNNWWTMPVPFGEEDVLANLAALREGLYEPTGFFFDSYAMDMGWSDAHSIWQVDGEGYPEGFSRIGAALAAMGSRPGLWVSPSSLYPPALDNGWLAEQGYEVSPGSHLGRFACLARGGRYQREFRDAVVAHARAAGLAHVKFDGLAWPCTAEGHGHAPGEDSFYAIAEGLREVFDALREQNPEIALEPTCLGYWPSPWWLMHTPYVIGPFGDDSPRGVSPCPDWLESMTTARDAVIREGDDAFWLPSDALECFDVIIQCPGEAYNHLVMAVARGHWFHSTYINPRFMDAEEWRFFAELMRWTRAHRDELRQPVLLGGSPRAREAYGYAYVGAERTLCFVRNPWIEPATIALPSRGPGTLRWLYPRREATAAPAEVELGPYELAVIEWTDQHSIRGLEPPPYTPANADAWDSTHERIVYDPEPAPFGPDWTSPDGDAAEILAWRATGEVELAAPGELCLLIEGPPGGAPATAGAELDGQPLELRQTGSRGGFSATGAAPVEEWQWFTAPLAVGRHRLDLRAALGDAASRCGAWVRGALPARRPLLPEPWADFPLPPHPARPWAIRLAALESPPAELPAQRARRAIERIDGLYLDSLPWRSATAGWGEVRRNRSIMDQPMTMAGRRYHRGLGAHAESRIEFDLPPGHRLFAATIGCDQEVWANSIVFVVEGDGVELYRSPLLRRDDAPLDVTVPIDGVSRLALLIEDGGDGIAADHGNWAEARIVR